MAKVPLQVRAPFARAVLASEGGEVIASVAPSWEVERTPPDGNALASAVRQAAVEGLLPQRSRLDLDAGRALVLSGDETYLGLSFESPPQESTVRAMLGGLLSTEDIFKAYLRPYLASPKTFLAVGRALQLGFGSTVPAVARPEVFVHATVHRRGPSLVVRLRLRNALDAPARGVIVRFNSARDFLRPTALFGSEAQLHGTTIHLLSPLAPGLREFQLRLEPQRPWSSPLTFDITYTDAKGNDHVVAARPLGIEVQFPGLAKYETRGTESTRALLARDDLARSLWRVRFTRAVTPEFAFARAMEALEREHPVKLLEYRGEDPPYFEAWYLAATKEGARPVIMETTVRGTLRTMEFRLAAQRPEDVLGVKAEVYRRLRELLSERFMGRQTPPGRSEARPLEERREAPQLHSNLMMRHLQGELRAEELSRELLRTAFLGVSAREDRAAGAAPSATSRSPRPPRVLAGHFLAPLSAGDDLEAGLLDAFVRVLAPVVLVQTTKLVAPSARTRTGSDFGAETEILDFDLAD